MCKWEILKLEIVILHDVVLVCMSRACKQERGHAPCAHSKIYISFIISDKATSADLKVLQGKRAKLLIFQFVVITKLT